MPVVRSLIRIRMGSFARPRSVPLATEPELCHPPDHRILPRESRYWPRTRTELELSASARPKLRGGGPGGHPSTSAVTFPKAEIVPATLPATSVVMFALAFAVAVELGALAVLVRVVPPAPIATLAGPSF